MSDEGNLILVAMGDCFHHIVRSWHHSLKILCFLILSFVFVTNSNNFQDPTGTKVKGSTKTRARSSIIDIDQYPSLYVDNNEYIQASNSHLFPFLNKDQSGEEQGWTTRSIF